MRGCSAPAPQGGPAFALPCVGASVAESTWPWRMQGTHPVPKCSRGTGLDAGRLLGRTAVSKPPAAPISAASLGTGACVGSRPWPSCAHKPGIAAVLTHLSKCAGRAGTSVAVRMQAAQCRAHSGYEASPIIAPGPLSLVPSVPPIG